MKIFTCKHCGHKMTAFENISYTIEQYQNRHLRKKDDGKVYCPKCGEFETKNFEGRK